MKSDQLGFKFQSYNWVILASLSLGFLIYKTEIMNVSQACDDDKNKLLKHFLPRNPPISWQWISKLNYSTQKLEMD